MASPKEILTVSGREVAVSNPQKVYFPQTGLHEARPRPLLPRRCRRRAARASAGRPMALKRFVDGAAGEPFFQKRAPDNRPDWIRTAELTFPSGRTADEIVLDDAAGLAWVVNLGCIDLNPHPVRADDLDHPDELRVDLDPVPGVPWSQIRDVALATREALTTSAWSAGRRRRGRAASTSTSASSVAGRTPRSAGPPSPSRATSSDACRTPRHRNGGRRSATACSSTTTRTPRTGPSRPRIPCGRCPMRASRRP